MASLSALANLSSELAHAVEAGEKAVVAVHGRPHVPSSGVLWGSGAVVTTDHTLRRDEEITVTLPDGRNVPATLAGRDGQIDRFIRPDVNIYTGFSGGALVDVEGRVIGVNTSGLTRGTGVTIPAATVSRVTSELLSRGHVRRGYFGVGLHPVRLPD